MFDIAFSEMIIVAVIALVIVGPERLPKLARQVGEWMGKLQRYVADVKTDLNRQMELEELRSLQKEVKSAASDIESSMRETIDRTQSDFNEVSSALGSDSGSSGSVSAPATDWERVYETRRVRDRLRDRRLERDKELGRKRPKARSRF
ncbi:MAG: Sec-independent protein translocase protein TatB [Burkholderiaceae bacterium]